MNTMRLKEYIESNVNKVKKVDSDESLELFCYTSCTNDDDSLLKSCRGVAFDGNEMVLKSFPYTLEYEIEDLRTVCPDIKKYRFFDSCEGTLIRVFYYKKWYISTHRRLDAFKSKWSSSSSYGDLFVQALNMRKDICSEFYSFLYPSSDDAEMGTLEAFLSKLDKNKQYMFLLQNNKENRIVCKGSQYSKLYHVGTFENGLFSLEIDIQVPYPSEKIFKNWEEVKEYVDTLDHQEYQGVIMYDGYDQVKILNPKYKYLFSLRGNEPNIQKRYLQIRMNQRLKLEYIDLYSEYRNKFNEIEKVIHELGIQILSAYKTRFIYKQHIVLYPEEYKILRECHSWHIENRSTNKISMNKVFEVLNKQESYIIEKMIARFLTTHSIVNPNGL